MTGPPITFGSGVYSARVVNRSVEEPALSGDITYTARADDSQRQGVVVVNATPINRGVDMDFAALKLNPAPIGQPCLIQVIGGQAFLYITGETPVHEECSDGA